MHKVSAKPFAFDREVIIKVCIKHTPAKVLLKPAKLNCPSVKLYIFTYLKTAYQFSGGGQEVVGFCVIELTFLFEGNFLKASEL